MTQGTKLFGFQIPVQPKFLVGGLLGVVVAVAVYNFMGGSDDATTNNARPSVVKATSSAVTSSMMSPTLTRRLEAGNKGKQGALRLKPVDPSSVIDPTLKLGMLDRVRSVKLIEGGRNLFDTGADIAQVQMPQIPVVKPMLPKPLPIGPVQPAPPPPPPHVQIPLRYYGFVRPTLRGDGNRGYFMDGENILMATEGDVLESRFLVVALSPNTARIEDIQLKQGQDLPLIPEAVVAQ